MRCVIACFLAAGVGLGVYGCTTAQRQAAVDGFTQGATGQPASPPAQAPGTGFGEYILIYLSHLAAYATGSLGKGGVRALKLKRP